MFVLRLQFKKLKVEKRKRATSKLNSKNDKTVCMFFFIRCSREILWGFWIALQMLVYSTSDLELLVLFLLFSLLSTLDLCTVVEVESFRWGDSC